MLKVFSTWDLEGLLGRLQADTKPEWGIMTAQHMVEHLSYGMRFCNGKAEIALNTPPEQLENFRRFLFSDKDFPINYPAPYVSGLPELRFASLAEAIEVLLTEVEDYHSYFAVNPDETPMNPAFGRLNREEWEHFHAKHFDHHFRQFGIK
jgi:hypothetical protein